jgi:nucleoside-diphosphate-sugar epimerase
MRLFITGGSGFIGTNFIAHACARGDEVLNLDLAAPLNPDHRAWWRQGDILDAGALTGAMQAFNPDAVVHLAARTDCDEDTTVEQGYRANTDGTRNVLEAIRATPGIGRAILTSSQYVCGPGALPQHDEDYAPHTVYGRSKVITEQLTRRAGLTCCWTLIRPTNIWGPWHMRYRREAWRVIRRGLYLHPAGAPVVRAYGYVGNIVHYVQRILEAPRSQVDRRTLYLSDPPGDIYRWASAFSLALCGRPARRAPRWLLHGIGRVGDGMMRIGLPFPLTSSRYRNMTGNYVVPVQATYDLLGLPPISLEEGVRETVRWLETDPHWRGGKP